MEKPNQEAVLPGGRRRTLMRVRLVVTLAVAGPVKAVVAFPHSADWEALTAAGGAPCSALRCVAFPPPAVLLLGAAPVLLLLPPAALVLPAPPAARPEAFTPPSSPKPPLAVHCRVTCVMPALAKPRVRLVPKPPTPACSAAVAPSVQVSCVIVVITGVHCPPPTLSVALPKAASRRVPRPLPGTSMAAVTPGSTRSRPRVKGWKGLRGGRVGRGVRVARALGEGGEVPRKVREAGEVGEREKSAEAEKRGEEVASSRVGEGSAEALAVALG